MPLPVPLAENCTCAPGFTCGLLGEIVSTGVELIVTVADAEAVDEAADVAVTVTVAGLGAFAGAVYRPAVETVPQVAPEQPLPFTDHVTAVFVLPVTFAVNCCWPDRFTWALVGEIVTDTVAAA